jgi:hypothetical protein
MILELDCFGVEGGVGVGELEALDGIEQDGGDGDVAIPLVVGGDDEPGSVFVAGVGEDVGVSVLILRPEFALVDVGVGELPILFGFVDAGLEAACLLGAGDVQEELEDDDVVVDEHALEGVDVFEATTHRLGGDELVDTRGEDVFVVRAVEDADHASGRDCGVSAPEEVVTGLKRCGHLERGDIAALGVDAGEDVADGAVLAGGVHALENDEQGLLLAGVEDLLQLVELSAVLDEDCGSGLLRLVVAGVGARPFLQPDMGVRLDEIGRLDFHESITAQLRLRGG